jgi:predicted enzyme related to lactoylglutathione lyase
MIARLALCAALAALPTLAPAAEPPPGHVTGIGGIFVKSNNPKALAAWYKTMLGLNIEDWGGALLRYDAPQHPPRATRNAQCASKYTAPSTRDFMIDFAVDNLDALIARLTASGVPILKRTDDPTGHFAWILDPDGTKIELWQPIKP